MRRTDGEAGLVRRERVTLSPSGAGQAGAGLRAEVPLEIGNRPSVQARADRQAGPEPGQAASQSFRSAGTWHSQSENCGQVQARDHRIHDALLPSLMNQWTALSRSGPSN